MHARCKRYYQLVFQTKYFLKFEKLNPLIMGENLQLMFQISVIVCLILFVKGQTEGSTCTDIQYVDVIPDCTFGCFCVSRQNAIPRIECRDEPTSCLVSNECSDPEIPPGCRCPRCLQGRHCVALTEDQIAVKVPEGASNVPVGCAICSCQNIPTTSTFVNIVSNKIDLGNIQPRQAECDYQLCPPTFNNGLDGEDGEDATVNGPGRDGLDGGQGFDVNSRRYPNCAVVDQSRRRDSEADRLTCDYGCFCNLDSGRTVCVIPPACSVSNRCSNPIEGLCGCPSCPVDQIGSSFHAIS
ncbi:uncharacterized protein LOC117106756 [Anneissia japonica]|uniref:uncharacterized protein LOC117106756 n=1 Tax=Anneissia japonica TaxID=1529436 RepID=UPI0014255BF8|nr:uncharacterized protein LOC117106756 [Anneissia japonica]